MKSRASRKMASRSSPVKSPVAEMRPQSSGARARKSSSSSREKEPVSDSGTSMKRRPRAAVSKITCSYWARGAYCPWRSSCMSPWP